VIVQKYHHMHVGTHEYADMLEWLAARSWLPVSIDAIKADHDANAKNGCVFLPYPTETWVRDDDRMAAASTNKHWFLTNDRLIAAGWTMVHLYDLSKVMRVIRDVAGFRCRGCQTVYPWPGTEDNWRPVFECFPTEYDPETDAICALCARAADDVAMKRPRAIERAIKMPWIIQNAREAVRDIRTLPRKRLPALVRNRLTVIELLLGIEEPSP
jgi:hypothetical protein